MGRKQKLLVVKWSLVTNINQLILVEYRKDLHYFFILEYFCDLQRGPNFVCLVFVMIASTVDAWAIKFSPDSRFLASGSHTGKINLFGVDSGRKESSMDTRGKFTLSLAYVSF